MNVIHIGSWKTATTTVQALCRKNTDKLKLNGYSFIDQRSKDHQQKFQPKFRQAIKKIQKFGDQADIAESIDLFDQLHKQHDQRYFFHSWEGLLGHPFNSSSSQMFHPEATAYWLKKLSMVKEIRVVLTIRRQIELVEAMYAQEVRKGRVSYGIDKFINEKIPEDLSWSKVITPLIESLGEENVKIVPYEWMERSKKLFLDSVFQGVMNAQEINTDLHSNPSYSHVAVEISRLANLYLESKDVLKMEKFLSENFSNITHRRSQFLTSDLEKKIYERCSSNDQAILEKLSSDISLKELGYFR